MQFKGKNRAMEIGSEERSKKIVETTNDMLSRLEKVFTEELLSDALAERRAADDKSIAELGKRWAEVKDTPLDELEKEHKHEETEIKELKGDVSMLMGAWDRVSHLAQLDLEKWDMADQKEIEEKKLKAEKEKASAPIDKTDTQDVFSSGQKMKEAPNAEKIANMEKRISEISKEIEAKDSEINKIVEEVRGLSAQSGYIPMGDIFGNFGADSASAPTALLDRINNEIKKAEIKISVQEDLYRFMGERIDFKNHGEAMLNDKIAEKAWLDLLATDPEKAIRESIVMGINAFKGYLESGPKYTAKDEAKVVNEYVSNDVFDDAEKELKELNVIIDELEKDNRKAEKQEKKVRHELAITASERFLGRAGKKIGRIPSSDIANERAEDAKGIINKALPNSENYLYFTLGKVLLDVAKVGDVSRMARTKAGEKERTPYVIAANEYIHGKGLADRAAALIAAVGPKEKIAPGNGEGSGHASATAETQLNAVNYDNAEWADENARDEFIRENKHLMGAFKYAQLAFNGMDKQLKDAFNSGTLNAAQAVEIYRILSSAWAEEQRGVFKGAAKDNLLSKESIYALSVEDINYMHSKAIVAHYEKLDPAALGALESSIGRQGIEGKASNIRKNNPLMRSEEKTASMPPPEPEVNGGAATREESHTSPHPVNPRMILRKNDSRSSDNGGNGAGAGPSGPAGGPSMEAENNQNQTGSGETGDKPTENDNKDGNVKKKATGKTRRKKKIPFPKSDVDEQGNISSTVPHIKKSNNNAEK